MLVSLHIDKWNKEEPPITEKAEYRKNKESIQELKSLL